RASRRKAKQNAKQISQGRPSHRQRVCSIMQTKLQPNREDCNGDATRHQPSEGLADQTRPSHIRFIARRAWTTRKNRLTSWRIQYAIRRIRIAMKKRTILLLLGLFAGGIVALGLVLFFRPF